MTTKRSPASVAANARPKNNHKTDPSLTQAQPPSFGSRRTSSTSSGNPTRELRKPKIPKPNGRKNGAADPGAGKGLPRQRMLAKLKESNLTSKDADSLGLESMTATQSAALGLSRAGDGFKIPYFSPDGKPLPMFRYRYFETSLKNGFLKGAALRKYDQPKDTDAEVYFPRLPGMNWERIIKDHDEPLHVTEGELKAACATKMGFTTIGLGGVYNFGSYFKAQTLIPSMQQIAWKGREVFICYDSDASSNHQVVVAESRLARILTNQGAFVHVVRLPALDKQKTGLDDYLVKLGEDEFDTLRTQTPVYAEVAALHALNEEVIYITHPSMIVVYPKPDHPPEQERYRTISCSTFTNEVYANARYSIRRDDKLVERSVAKDWMAWPNRAAADSFTYAPGKDPIVNGNQFNTWEGWGCKAIKDDVTPFLTLFNHLSTRLSEAHRQWLLQWLAWPIQHPGIEGKMNTAVVLHGIQGSGKSSLGYTMKEVYGDANFYEATHDDLAGSFNGWARHRQFVLGEEMTGGDPDNVKNLADIMKHHITGQKITVKEKYIREYSLPNVVNFLLTSNSPDCADIGNDDRRYFIHEVPGEKLPRQFWDNYYKWLKQGGAEAVHWYLRYEVDTAGFDPKAPAPHTKARQAMIDEVVGKTPAGQLALHIRDAKTAQAFFDKVISARFSANVRQGLCRNIWNLEEFIKIVRPHYDDDKRISEHTLGKVLRRRLGFKRTERSGKRLWVLFNRAKYEKWSDAAIVGAYKKEE